MKRLTKRGIDGIAYLANVKGDEQEIEGSKDTLKCVYESWQKLAEYEDEEEKQQIKLRPCILATGTNAIFHRWIDKARIVDPSAMVGGHEGGVVKITVGIVEYANGEVHECYPTEIRFTDRGKDE